ncbi:MAG: glycosyltransferase family 39 protein [Bacteroidales bacterium]|nr:glycosyltransferase family 39 protein [Bacteroidales bacterium]
MPDKLQRHFNLVGVGIYLLALIAVSLSFQDYALRPLWMVWGIGTVLLFFGMTYLVYRQWNKDTTKTFTKKLFWLALATRIVYVVCIYFYYRQQTGFPMEYAAADSKRYHETACYLSQLAREGYFKAIFQQLDAHTMGFSDQGYLLYLTTIYAIFGKNILLTRLLKALMSAYMCVAIYRLTARNLDEKTARLAAIVALFLPQFIHYNGTYLKETEMIFLATLALERFDYMVHEHKYTIVNILVCILLTALSFGFRTVVGMTLIFSYIVCILFADKATLSKKSKGITLGAIAILILVFVLTPIGKEMLVMVKLNIKESNYMVVKYNQYGMRYADYASYKTMAPGAFVLPLTNLVEVANENQKMMNGTYFIKNYLAFFAIWCIVVAIREKRWRNFSLIGSYTLAYVLIIAFSFAVNSERYHLPAMPGIVIMAAFAMTHFRKKDFPFYYVYCALLLIAIFAWNYIKLSGRGLIF